MLIDRPLRHGNNPHQKQATFTASSDAIEILNGEPSHTNLLDILIGWQMTRDVFALSGELAAVSMKHCVPVGLATPGPIDAFTRALLDIEDAEPPTSAYLRARSSDWGAAYGDIAVIFGSVNEELANTLGRLVSDGIAATGYSDDALRLLSRKRSGKYLVVRINENYVPPDNESREVMGVKLSQQRNDYLPDARDFVLVAGSENLIRRAIPALLLASVAMKYTVSNNIVVASGSRTLSISAGQQSRILSTKLACFKYDQFNRLQNGEVTDFIRSASGRLTDKIGLAAKRAAIVDPQPCGNEPVSLLSDGFIPFRDNIEEAHRYGIEVVCEPEGAMRSEDIELAVKSYGMSLVRTRRRFFYH